jgi:ABC-type amino acid transport substrate-binding protein
MKKLVTTITLLCFCVAVTGCVVDQQIQTLRSGVLTVAVTSIAPTNQYDSQLWIRQYVEQFAAEQELEISWVVVPFNESWLLASTDEVDLVATNVANFPDRAHPGDQQRYEHISDFIGKTVGVVVGMASERDVNRRAPDGVIVRTTDTFAQLYAEFDIGQLDAIAEAEYYALDGKIIPSHGEEIILIDHHDLTPGQREESVFVVSNNSQNLLSAVNAFIAQTKFPL